MVHVPHSYTLNQKDGEELVAAMEGDVVEQVKWIAKLKKWKAKFDVQMQIYHLTKKWLEDFGRKNGWDEVPEHGFAKTPEEALDDKVHHYMEYTPFQWNDKENKVEANKYNHTSMLLSVREEILTYLNENIKM